MARAITRSSSLAASAKLNAEMVAPTVMGQEWCGKRTWSQHGEDDVLMRELSQWFKNGYYVDVGANHPARLSNTFRLYANGMSGLLVEPTDRLCAMHLRYRPRDIVLNTAIGPRDGLAKFYELASHQFSTFSKEDADMRIAGGIPLTRIAYKPIFTLRTILSECTPENRDVFALLSVDAEGWDEEILRSNDWDRFRPVLTVVEANTSESDQRIESLMSSVGYARIATCGVNGIFKDTRR